MSSLSSVLVKFTADISDLQSKLKQGLGEVQSSARQMSTFGSLAGQGFTVLKGVAAASLTAVAVGATAAGIAIKKGIDFNAEMQQARISFETLLGSADKAKQMIANLQDFSAKTPFEFPGIQKSAKLMLAMGFNANSIMPNLQKVGDAVAAIGGNQETLQGVTMALGQMMTKGKVSAEEMNQLAERGIPAWELMAQKMGMSKQELMRLSAEGKVMAEEALPALIDAMGTKFSGAMEKQSKSFSGMISTLKDNMNILIGKAVEPLFERLTKIMPMVLNIVNKVTAGLQSGGIKGALEAIFPQRVVNAIMAIGNAIKGVFDFLVKHWAIVKPILVGVLAGFTAWLAIVTICSTVSAALTAVGAVIGFVASPIGITVVAIGALAAAGYALYTKWDEIKAGLLRIWNAIKEATEPIWRPIAQIISLVMNEIKATLLPIFDTIRTWFTFFFDIYKQIVGSQFQAIWLVIQTIFGLIKNHVSFVFGVLKDIFVTSLTIIVTVVKTQLLNMFAIMKAQFQTVMAFIRAWWETIKTLFSAAFLTIYYLVTGQWGKIGEVWRSAGERIKSIVSNLWNTVKSIWSNAFASIYNSTVGAAGRVLGAISNLAHSIAGRFRDMVNNAVQMGKNLIQGLWNGIVSLGSWLANKVGSFFRENVLNKAKAILGIKSPSKVMMVFGKFTAQGFSMGIQKNAGLAENSASKMANGVINAVQGKTFNVSVGNGRFNAFIGSSPATASGPGANAGVYVAQLVVREEADIDKIAEKLYRLQKRGQRAKGV